MFEITHHLVIQETNWKVHSKSQLRLCHLDAELWLWLVSVAMNTISLMACIFRAFIFIEYALLLYMFKILIYVVSRNVRLQFQYSISKYINILSSVAHHMWYWCVSWICLWCVVCVRVVFLPTDHSSFLFSCAGAQKGTTASDSCCENHRCHRADHLPDGLCDISDILLHPLQGFFVEWFLETSDAAATATEATNAIYKNPQNILYI